MLDMLKLTDSRWPVLTVYPPAYTPPDTLEESPPLRIQAPDAFNENGILRFSAKNVPSHIPIDKPFPTSSLAGGFVFGPSRLIEKVRPDPHIYFFGEEISLAARMWTHGFDLYSPNETLLYHYYIRKESSRHWNDDKTWHHYEERSLMRLRQILEPSNIETFRNMEDIGPYGLGDVRTLAEYEQFSGVNFSGKTIAQYARTYPFVLTDRVATSILQQKDLKLSEKAHLFIIEDQGIVFSEITGDFALLNASATYAWCSLENGAQIDDLVEAMETLLETSRTKAEQMVAGLLTHWQGLGLVIDSPNDITAPPLHADNWDMPSSASEYPPCPDMDAAHVRHCYRLLDCVVAIHFATPEHKLWIHPVLAHLETEYTQPHHVLMTSDDAGQHYLYVNGKPADRCRQIEELAPLAKFKLLTLATQDTDHMLNLHAGAVSDGQSCILLPAAAGSGKTSLTAALVHAGYTYFSDETALLERNTCYVRPVPLALTVKTTGTDLLAPMYPELRRLSVHARGDGKHVQYIPPPENACPPENAMLPVSKIVFPQYRAAAKTSLERLSKVDALGRILQHSVSFQKRLSLEDAITLIQWIKGVDCFDLIYTSFDDALPLISQASGREKNDG